MGWKLTHCTGQTGHEKSRSACRVGTLFHLRRVSYAFRRFFTWWHSLSLREYPGRATKALIGGVCSQTRCRRIPASERPRDAKTTCLPGWVRRSSEGCQSALQVRLREVAHPAAGRHCGEGLRTLDGNRRLAKNPSARPRKHPEALPGACARL